MSRYDFDDDYPPRRPVRPVRPAPPAWQQWLPALVLIILIIGLIWWLVPGGEQAPHFNPEAEPPPITAKGEYTSEEQMRINLFQEVKDSVVNVDTLAIRRDFAFRLVELQQGTGSGFLWGQPGEVYVVTNYHVIAEAVRRPNLNVRVTLADQSEYTVQYARVAPEYDLAVLSIDAPQEKLKPIKVGTSSDLKVGQDAFAIGNPFGQELTFTNGIISALNREIMSPVDVPIPGALQTNAALNPGNSGGPLLDRWGRLIGVNTAITSPSGANTGIGYAIPVDTVREVVTELIRQGRAPKTTLGITPLREQFTRDLGFERGVIIQDVTSGGPADKAGLIGIQQNPDTGRWRLGDIIVGIDGEPVQGIRELNQIIARHKPGDTVTLTVRRDRELREVEVTLEGV